MALPPLNTTHQAGPYPTARLPQSPYGGRVFAALARDPLAVRLSDERLARLRGVLTARRLQVIRDSPRIATDHIGDSRRAIPVVVEVVPQREYQHVVFENRIQTGESNRSRSCQRDCCGALSTEIGVKFIWACIFILPGAIFLGSSFLKEQSSQTSQALLGTGIGMLTLGVVPLILMCHDQDDD